MKYLLVALCLGPVLGALLLRLAAGSGMPIGAAASLFGGPPAAAPTALAQGVQNPALNPGAWNPSPTAPAPVGAVPTTTPGGAAAAPVAAAPAPAAAATAVPWGTASPAPLGTVASAPTAAVAAATAPGVPAATADLVAPGLGARPSSAAQNPVDSFAPAAQTVAPASTFEPSPAGTATDAIAVAPAAADWVAPAANSAPVDPLIAYGPAPAPLVDPRRFTEAHWQGIEVIPKTARLAKMLGLPADATGVVIDDVTLPADLQGFQAGDLVVSVSQVPTPDLVSFIAASDRVRDRRRAEVEILRGGQTYALVLSSLLARLGNANGETPPMIPPGARMPHEYLGACTNCHRIGTTGTLPVDQGDAMTKTAPTIRSGSRCPHRARGACSSCHDIVP